MNSGNDINWPDSVSQEINDAVVKGVAKVRIAQKVFPTTVLRKAQGQSVRMCRVSNYQIQRAIRITSKPDGITS
jgi:hypothetical protein